MKLFQFPIATVDLARFFPVFVRNPLPLLLCSMTLTGTTILTAPPARAQTFYQPLTFEQNRGQAPTEVKWLGHSSSYRALFAGTGATFLHRDENDTRAMAERQPVPVGNFQDRGRSHHSQAMPKSRRPGRKLAPIEGTTPAGRRLSSGPQTSSDGAIPAVPQIPKIR
jgi:hypothetical protein